MVKEKEENGLNKDWSTSKRTLLETVAEIYSKHKYEKKNLWFDDVLENFMQERGNSKKKWVNNRLNEDGESYLRPLSLSQDLWEGKRKDT